MKVKIWTVRVNSHGNFDRIYYHNLATMCYPTIN